eukprot:gb/GECH01012061.1/.p1 GENE.gb/GECH01012061.1/~~gb/GECH01012061.1/.p1  ORF type:complete len:261 (+),score=61.84 gb/GECH01012061.1/:1-783(+)
MSKVVIVTGASRGIGKHVARNLSVNLGANVVLTARSSDALEKVRDSIQSEGGKCHVVAGDLCDSSMCKRVVDEALSKYGRIDSVVHNAGVIEPIQRVENIDIQKLKHNFDVNLFSIFELTKLVLPHIRKNSGNCVFVSSGAALKSFPAWTAYSTSKSALNQLNLILADEEPDITCVAVRPGVVATEMQKTIREQGKEEMESSGYNMFYQMHETGQLLDPAISSRALAVLALHAPKELTGKFISWDDDNVQKLVKTHLEDE